MKMTEEKIAKARKMRDAGMFYKEIGASLGIGISTVRYHVNPVYREKYDAYRVAREDEIKAFLVDYRISHKDEFKAWRIARKEDTAVYSMAYRMSHKKEASEYRRRRLSENTANAAARRALKLGTMIGATAAQLAEIKEIYRRAKEDKKVRCYLCGRLIPIGHRHVDHITPLSKSGLHRPANLAVACDSCNLKKNAKTTGEMGILL